MPTSLRLDLIRHAKTAWNASHRIQGQTDTPLSAEGKRMAARWADRLAPIPYDAILTSDLTRARQTAAAINEHRNLPVTEDARLREQDWGDWVGLQVCEIEGHICRPGQDYDLGWNFRPPGGESRIEVRDRALAALGEYEGHARVLVVAHLGVLKTVCYHLAGRRFALGEEPLLQKYRRHRLVRESELRIDVLNLPIGPSKSDPS
jgi:probable phosphoglycerate mutase